jgi:hypothetical protein
MKTRLSLLIVALLIVQASCMSSRGSNEKIVRPKYHHRWFNHKKDKKIKRTKIVRMKG